MPIKADVATTQSGEMENAKAMLLSEAVEMYTDGALDDAIIIVIPDTGKAAFNGSHEIKSGKSAGKMSKATFVVAELGSSFAGLPIAYRQGNGEVSGLPLSVKMSITATPPNRDGKTVEEALNRTVKLEAVRTGTDG